MEKNYISIVRHYEDCLGRHGATAKGMDWPNPADLERRFEIMLDPLMRWNKSLSLLDLGCGVGLLWDHIKAKNLENWVTYCGIDISKNMIAAACERHPDQRFLVQDILEKPLDNESVDFVVMNGVLTEKRELSYGEMEGYAKRLLSKAFSACKKGIAFNVMQKYVDWERDDLFHWSLDAMAHFVVSECSRNFVVRSDYGLYEYTVYVYREPVL